jgi:hypothetical protein
MVRQAGAVALAHGTEPDFQRLPEADRADMEFFSDQLSLLLPLAGFDLFRRTSTLVAASLAPNAVNVVFTFSTAGAMATGQETDDGFVVLAASTARRTPTETFQPDTWRTRPTDNGPQADRRPKPGSPHLRR